MKSLAGTKTEANLRNAFAGESRARASYGLFAAKAKEEGHKDAALYFETTSANEQEHANIWLRFLGGDSSSAAKAGENIAVGATKDNLQKAIDGETFENSNMYPGFVRDAREEGFDAIAKLFDQVSEIEKTHAEHFKRLLDRLASTAAKHAPVALKDTWKCGKCGNIASAQSAPGKCEVCGNDGGTSPAYSQLVV